ncbi:DMT family transporter [Microbacterium sp. LEMMJ01]|uniref:DMT family transporter n=1 Tax=Microbacterium sp. LEMMJ01 TaxID=1978350 RepID=UPI000A1E951C|nr:SMR family transporter [Microbacterium sp. LEMMJ01]OSP07317.1 QacE family quaternary ammonium compound efflux SMR transporter [Microbacterium sp. LEMMJ01]
MTVLALFALIGAIVGEVTGTVSLRLASDGKKPWWIGVALGYVFAFTMLSVVLAQGVPLGIAYGIWAAAGVAITAVLSRIFFKEPLTWVMSIGIVLIIGGVLLIELGAAH